MNQKKNAIVYPYNFLITPLVRYRHLLSDYKIVGLVSPSGLSLGRCDASEADFGETIGIEVTEDFVSALEQCDTVILSEYPMKNKDAFFHTVLNNIMSAMQKGKQVLCLMELDNCVIEFFQLYAKQCHVPFQAIHYGGPSIEHYLKMEQKVNQVPIVGILGAYQNCSKFELQLALRDIFLQSGYRVTQVGTKPYGELLKIHSFPEFMFEKHLESDKIYAFHQYICELEEMENPDLIILGIPGGIVTNNPDSKKDFNILPFEIINAINIDYLAFAVMENQVNNRIYRKFCNTLLYKYNTPINAYCISNVRINHESLLKVDTSDIVYDILPQNCFCDVHEEKLSFPYFRIHKREDVIRIANDIETTFTSNAQTHLMNWR